MTGTELKQRTASLGFRSGVPDVRLFYDSANLALAEVNRIRPLKKRLTFRVHGGETVELTALEGGASVTGIIRHKLHTDLSEGAPTASSAVTASPEIIGTSVVIPEGVSGTLECLCYRRPVALDADTMELPLDVDPVLGELLPLLVASYLWRDDYPDYASAYREEFDAACHRLPVSLCGADTVTTNGW